MKSLLIWQALVLLLAVGACQCSTNLENSTATTPIEYAPIVQLKAGKVVGVVQTIKNGTGKVHKYEGIRYGLAERFAKPTAVPPWTDVYNATHAREKCPQLSSNSTSKISEMFATTKLMGENCLYLSVWRKADTTNTTADKPVMAFIHGGTYLGGSIFNSGGGQYLAYGGDVIVVTIAYRLSALGLLTGAGIPANLQLHDQIFALKWIQENIAAFGGNPKRVTLFGESSGSMNVGQLILSPLARGLFSQAIMQSGGPLSFFGVDNQTAAAQKRAKLTRLIGCPAEPESVSMTCLQQKSIDDFINVTSNINDGIDFFMPVVGDNEVLPFSISETLKRGAFNHLSSIIYGVNANEGSHFILEIPGVTSNSSKLTIEQVKREIVAIIKKFGAEYGEEVADYYLAELKNSSNVTQDQLKVAIADSMGDYVLTCTTILFGEGLASKSFAENDTTANTKFYSYRLAQHLEVPNMERLPFEGVTHYEDIIYLFFAHFLLRPVDKQLSDDMIASWTTFARTGIPGALPSADGTAVQWTEAVDDQHRYTRFMSLAREGDGFHMVNNDFYKKRCNDFWKARLLK